MGSWTELLEGTDEGELERRQAVERNNGPLAMIAITGLMVQDGMLGLERAVDRFDWGRGYKFSTYAT